MLCFVFFPYSWLIACSDHWPVSQSSFLVAPTVGVICFESSVQYQPTVQFGMDCTPSLQAGWEQFVVQNESCQVRRVKLSSHDCLSLRVTNIRNINVSILLFSLIRVGSTFKCQIPSLTFPIIVLFLQIYNSAQIRDDQSVLPSSYHCRTRPLCH